MDGRGPHLLLRDRRELGARGVQPSEAMRQFQLLRNPPPPPFVIRPCTAGDGIERLTLSDRRRLARLAGDALRAGRFSRFVPASGAATRLFSDLLQLDQERKTSGNNIRSILKTNQNSFARSSAHFFASLPRFALYEPLRRLLGDQRLNVARLLAAQNYDPILDALIHRKGMNVTRRPKGLIPFHWVGRKVVSAFEEHLREALPLRDKNRSVRVHFTVARDFLSEIKKLGQERIRFIKKHFGITVRLTFSLQNSETDTLALERGKGLVRGLDGRLLLRPGGHGALLKNLEKTLGDIVFMKNIDNVPVSSFQAEGNVWRQALAGRLIEVQTRGNAWARVLDRGGASRSERIEAEEFIQVTLGRVIPRSVPLPKRIAWMLHLLNRPWRVCGMVPNTGEPGGGPFWVKSPWGDSRQILEVAQLGVHQKKLLKKSTHFNPVDMVVGLRDGEGHPYSLDRFADLSQVIVGRKRFEGREIRTLEHPGLWNGGMAHWNTVFVEIPADLFHPVKTINDLLRPGHCSRKKSMGTR